VILYVYADDRLFYSCNSIDFPPKYQSWDATDPFELFEAPTIKAEANPKVLESAL
jgi:hypothetical protein